MITTTLSRILAHGPCGQDPCDDGELAGWLKLLAGLGKSGSDDEPLPYADILSINGIDDALWACRCEPQNERVWRLLAVRIARRVQHLTRDQRSITVLEVAERHADGSASDAELAEAWTVARAEAWASSESAAWAVAWTVARDAAWAVRDAAMAATLAAAREKAWTAAREEVWTAARAEAWASAESAAWDAERAAQAALFLEVVS